MSKPGSWLTHRTQVRHHDNAERTLLAAIAHGASPAELATFLLTAVTDRTFADGGHALDFINKAFSVPQTSILIGRPHTTLLPIVMRCISC